MGATDTTGPVERIRFGIEAGPVPETLKQTKDMLGQIAAEVDKVNKALASGLPAGMLKTKTELRGMMDRLGVSGGKKVDITPQMVAKELNIGPDAFSGWLKQNSANTRGWMQRDAFRSAQKAVEAAQEYLYEQVMGSTAGALTNLIRGLAGSGVGYGGARGPVQVDASVPGAKVQAEVSGEIKLLIPAAQIKAVVQGDITATTTTDKTTTDKTTTDKTTTTTKNSQKKESQLGQLPAGRPDDITGETRTQYADGRVLGTRRQLRAGGVKTVTTYDEATQEILRKAETTSDTAETLRRYAVVKKRANAAVANARRSSQGRPRSDVAASVGAAGREAVQMLAEFEGSEAFKALPPEVQRALAEDIAIARSGFEAGVTGQQRTRMGAALKENSQQRKAALRAAMQAVDDLHQRALGDAGTDPVRRQQATQQMYAAKAGVARDFGLGAEEEKFWALYGGSDQKRTELEASQMAAAESLAAQKKVRGGDRASQRDYARRMEAVHRELAGQLMGDAAVAHETKAEAFRQQAERHEAYLAKPSRRGPGGGAPSDHAGKPPPLPGGKASEHSRGLVTPGLSGFTLGGFAKNLGTVTGWGLAANTAMAGFNFAGESAQRAVEIQMQTARLDQIFRGVGGSAQQLTNDVLKLAAAEGQASDEAMKSAVQWSRLGLTRKQVNEAVKVSLQAANVAEISASEATEHLSSLMAVYGLRVGELKSVLGELNQTSNTLNVTTADLLDGLSRSASVAKQAGMSFAELQGHIGGIVSQTGQTGAMAGNAMKSILVSLSSQTVQEQLRSRYGIEATDQEGNVSMANLWKGYQKMDATKQREVSELVAGKTQGTRFMASMDAYVRSTVKAYEATLNLNSAESENAKIKATIAKQLVGLRSEVDRNINAAANSKGWLGGKSSMQNASDVLYGSRVALHAVGNAVEASGKLGDGVEKAVVRALGGGEKGKKNLGRLQSGLGGFVNLASGNLAGAFQSVMGNRELWETVERGMNPEDALEARREKYGKEAGGRSQFANRLNDLAEAAPQLLKGGQVGEFLEDFKTEFLKLDHTKFSAAAQAGNVEEVRRMLREEAGAQRESAKAASAQENAAFTAQLKALEGKTDEESIAKRRDLKGRKSYYAPEEEEELRDKDRYVARRGHVRSMDALRTGGLATLFKQVPLLTETSEVEQQMRLERAQADMKERTLKEANLSGSTMDSALRTELTEEAKRLRGGATGTAAALRREVATQQRDAGFVVQGVTSMADRSAVGLTEGERLLKRLGALNRMDDNPNARGYAGPGNAYMYSYQSQARENERYKTQMAIVDRVPELARQADQIKTESSFNLSKNLLLADPGERLRLAGLSQAMRAGKFQSAGAMMALDGKSAQAVWDMMGGDEGFKTKRELRQLTTFRTPEEAMQSPLVTEEAKDAARKGDYSLVRRDIANVRRGDVAQQKIDLAKAYDRNSEFNREFTADKATATVGKYGLDASLLKVGREVVEGLGAAAKAGAQLADVVNTYVTPAMQALADKVMAGVQNGPGAPAPRNVNTGATAFGAQMLQGAVMAQNFVRGALGMGRG